MPTAVIPSHPERSRRSRRTGVWIALVAITGLALQLGILLGAAWAKGQSGWSSVANFFSFFTVLTNLLVVLTFTWPATFWRGAMVRGGITLHIAVVGLVYEVALRRLWHPQGAQFMADLIMHDAIPLAVLAHWLFLRERGALRWRHAFAWLLYPAAYLVYALGRGTFTGWWAYPFLDADALGYVRVALHATVLFAVFIVLGLALVGWDRRASA